MKVLPINTRERGASNGNALDANEPSFIILYLELHFQHRITTHTISKKTARRTNLNIYLPVYAYK